MQQFFITNNRNTLIAWVQYYKYVEEVAITFTAGGFDSFLNTHVHRHQEGRRNCEKFLHNLSHGRHVQLRQVRRIGGDGRDLYTVLIIQGNIVTLLYNPLGFNVRLEFGFPHD